MLGGYVGATALGVMLGGVRAPPAARRGAAGPAGRLRGHLGVPGRVLIGPVMGVVSGYGLGLAGVGILLVFAAAAATAGLQAVLGLPGTLLAIIAMVVFGDPTAGGSIATPLLASPVERDRPGTAAVGRAQRRPQRDLPRRGESDRAAGRPGHLCGGRDTSRAGQRSLAAPPPRPFPQTQVQPA